MNRSQQAGDVSTVLHVKAAARTRTLEFPLVSVVTVVLNNCRTLERALQSVLTQEYPNVEYIVIDGDSSDGSRELIQRYSEKLDVFISERDNGLYDAMNKGLKLATGQLIGILNSDDWYEAHAVRTAVNAHIEDPLAVVHGMIRSHDGDMPIQCGASMSSQLPARMIPHSATFVPRTLYERHGNFNQGYKIAADYDLMLRFFKRGVEFRFVERVLANISVGGISDRRQVLGAMEKARIQFENGIISWRQFRIRQVKAAAIPLGHIVHRMAGTLVRIGKRTGKSFDR